MVPFFDYLSLRERVRIMVKVNLFHAPINSCRDHISYFHRAYEYVLNGTRPLFTDVLICVD